MKAKNGAIIIGVILAFIATLLFLVIPTSPNLIVSYIFCLLGIIMMEGAFLVATAKNVAASYASIMQAGRYLPITLVISALVFLFERLLGMSLSIRWHIIIQLIGLAIIAIQLTKVYSGASYVEQVGEKVAVQTANWTGMINQMNIITARESDVEVKSEIKKAAEALRYADPMSNEKTFTLDNQIADLIRSIQENDSTVRKELCQELILLLKERNAILKASK